MPTENRVAVTSAGVNASGGAAWRAADRIVVRFHDLLLGVRQGATVNP